MVLYVSRSSPKFILHYPTVLISSAYRRCGIQQTVHQHQSPPDAFSYQCESFSCHVGVRYTQWTQTREERLRLL